MGGLGLLRAERAWIPRFASCPHPSLPTSQSASLLPKKTKKKGFPFADQFSPRDRGRAGAGSGQGGREGLRRARGLGKCSCARSKCAPTPYPQPCALIAGAPQAYHHTRHFREEGRKVLLDEAEGGYAHYGHIAFAHHEAKGENGEKGRGGAKL